MSVTFPAGLTLVSVTGRVPTATSGQASFVRPYTLVGAADNSMVPPDTRYAALSATGEFTIELPATNDPGWIPVDSPLLVEIVSNSGIIRGTVLLDYQTTSVELADLIQVDGAATVGTSYIALSSRGVAGGVAALDADGDVNDAAGNKITGGGGGGGISATIVNAKGDLIAASAPDVVARFGVGSDGQVLTAASGQATGLSWATPTVYEAAGAAAAAVSTHAGLADPHTGYALESALGDAAVLDVGTGAGTVAAGDDSRITGAQQRSTLTTKGDLYVATGSATVVRLPVGSNTQVLTADSGETAGVKWAAGGGGGSTLVVKRGIVTSGNLTPQNTGSAWQALSGGPTLVIPAAVGDYIAADIMGMLVTPNASTFLDLAVVGAGAALVRFASSGTGTAAVEGDPAFYPDASFRGHGQVFDFVAQAGDIDGGNVTICIAVNSAGVGTVFASTAFPLRWRVLNHGAATVS